MDLRNSNFFVSSCFVIVYIRLKRPSTRNSRPQKTPQIDDEVNHVDKFHLIECKHIVCIRSMLVSIRSFKLDFQGHWEECFLSKQSSYCYFYFLPALENCAVSGIYLAV